MLIFNTLNTLHSGMLHLDLMVHVSFSPDEKLYNLVMTFVTCNKQCRLSFLCMWKRSRDDDELYIPLAYKGLTYTGTVTKQWKLVGKSGLPCKRQILRVAMHHSNDLWYMSKNGHMACKAGVAVCWSVFHEVELCHSLFCEQQTMGGDWGAHVSGSTNSLIVCFLCVLINFVVFLSLYQQVLCICQTTVT